MPFTRWTPLLACALAFSLAPSLVCAEPSAGDKYALLVGVHRYDKNELRDLPYAEADMTALAEVLKKAGYKRVVLMTEAVGADEPRFLPTAANVRKTLKGMLGDLSADESVLVAFAGHGIQFAGEDDNYFCPMDAKLADKSTLISLTEVYKDLEKCPAGTRLLLADCCRNDPRSDNARAVDKVKLASVTRPQRALPPGGVAAFFSCSAGEKAYEDAGIKHGVFFHFIIEGLQGKADADKDGQVDLDELAGYTKKQVRDFVKDTYGDDVRQMPELVGKTHGQVVLVGTGVSGQITNSIGMKLKVIKPGKFLMGSPKDEADRTPAEGPQHEVELTRPFYMGTCPVTRGQFAAFVDAEKYQTEADSDGTAGYGYNATTGRFENGLFTWKAPGHPQTDDYPVVYVSWNDATAFCAWLSKKEGKTYELSTEAEWEYVCRAGTTTRYWSGDSDDSLQGNANVSDASAKALYGASYGSVSWDDKYPFTSPVGRFGANPWGFYDMHGNVWQWCADRFDKDFYQNGPRRNPINSDNGELRAVRGGSMYVLPRSGRSAARRGFAPTYHNADLGFRIVLRPPAAAP